MGLALLVAVTAGCGGGGGDGLSNFKAPTGPTLALNQLSGDWGGRIDTGSAGKMCWNVAWKGATPDGTRSTGRFEILAVGQPFVNPMVGTMTATSNGSGYAVTLSVNPGAGGNASCMMTGTANLDAGLAPSGTGEQVLLGPSTMEWAPVCTGLVYAASAPSTQGGHLLLVKNSPVSGGC